MLLENTCLLKFIDRKACIIGKYSVLLHTVFEKKSKQ